MEHYQDIWICREKSLLSIGVARNISNNFNWFFQFKMDRDASRMRRETETLHDSLRKDKSTVESLEKLLSDSRREGTRQKLLAKESQEQVDRLQEKVDDLQGKL